MNFFINLKMFNTQYENSKEDESLNLGIFEESKSKGENVKKIDSKIKYHDWFKNHSGMENDPGKTIKSKKEEKGNSYNKEIFKIKMNPSKDKKKAQKKIPIKEKQKPSYDEWFSKHSEKSNKPAKTKKQNHILNDKNINKYDNYSKNRIKNQSLPREYKNPNGKGSLNSIEKEYYNDNNYFQKNNHNLIHSKNEYINSNPKNNFDSKTCSNKDNYFHKNENYNNKGQKENNNYQSQRESYNYKSTRDNNKYRSPKKCDNYGSHTDNGYPQSPRNDESHQNPKDNNNSNGNNDSFDEFLKKLKDKLPIQFPEDKIKKLDEEYQKLKSNSEHEFEDIDYNSLENLFSEIEDILSSNDLSNINKKDLIISMTAFGIICFCLMTPHIGSSYGLFSLMSSSDIIFSVSACTSNSSLVSTSTTDIFGSVGDLYYNSALITKDIIGVISALILYEKGESFKKIVLCILKSAECMKKFFSNKEVYKIAKKMIEKRETIENIRKSLSNMGKILKKSPNENNNQKSNDIEEKQSKEDKEEERRRKEEEERRRKEEEERKRKEEERRRREEEERRRREEAERKRREEEERKRREEEERKRREEAERKRREEADRRRKREEEERRRQEEEERRRREEQYRNRRKCPKCGSRDTEDICSFARDITQVGFAFIPIVGWVANSVWDDLRPALRCRNCGYKFN